MSIGRRDSDAQGGVSPGASRTDGPRLPNSRLHLARPYGAGWSGKGAGIVRHHPTCLTIAHVSAPDARPTPNKAATEAVGTPPDSMAAPCLLG